jgi:hypothetical protein
MNKRHRLGLMIFGFGVGFVTCAVMHPNIAPSLEVPGSQEFVIAWTALIGGVALFLGLPISRGRRTPSNGTVDPPA